MALDVWSEFKEQVRVQTDIVSLIGETRNVIPKHGGREYVALCPFHDDHNPSMTINPERQTYRCWVCDAGGDCFSYVMKLEGLDFRQALEQLAQRAGLEMPQSPSGQSRAKGLG
ncbi:MAG: CHC2 zinc finger domain-containing protein, partial [Planctomycetaceae bacterium]